MPHPAVGRGGGEKLNAQWGIGKQKKSMTRWVMLFYAVSLAFCPECRR